jgi:hypothetical protein
MRPPRCLGHNSGEVVYLAYALVIEYRSAEGRVERLSRVRPLRPRWTS